MNELSNFDRLYPDVQPELPLHLTSIERLAIAVTAVMLAFGGASGQLLIAGAGIGLLLFVIFSISTRPLRRIRNEARSRFPDMDWYEDRANSQLKLAWSVPLLWIVITALSAACLFLVPSTYTLTAAAICAVLTALLVWFAPGLSTAWKVREESGYEEYPVDGYEDEHEGDVRDDVATETFATAHPVGRAQH